MTLNQPGLVIVSGCFDPIHSGHIELFKAAKKLGTRLGVIIENDDYVRGKHPLLLSQFERANIVSQLSLVDQIYLNDEANGDCSNLLVAVRPEYFCVGPDYKSLTDVVEHRVCTTAGIKLKIIQHPSTVHSSELVAKLKPQYDNPPVTVSAILRVQPDKRVLLNQRPDKTWDLPGGFLEVDETLVGCIQRELREELGVGATNLEFLTSIPTTYVDGRKLLSVYFTGEALGTPTSSTESVGLRYVPTLPFGLNWFNVADRQALAYYFSQERN